MIDSVRDQAQALPSEQTAEFSALTDRYTQLYSAAKQLAISTEERAVEYESYLHSCKELAVWLDGVQLQLSAARSLCDNSEQLTARINTLLVELLQLTWC